MKPLFAEEPLTLEQGEHLCLFYAKNPAEQFPILIPYLREALENGEQFIYIADDQTVDALRARLEEHGIDLASARAHRQLKLWTRREWRQPGALSAANKARQVRQLAEEALGSGFKGVSFAVEMTWTLGPDISAEALEYWEATINTIFCPGFPGRIICQYNREKLSPEAVLGALHTHPRAIIRDKVCQNYYYEAPLILTANGTRPSAAAKAAWMLDQLQRSQLAEEQREATRRLELQKGAGETQRADERLRRLVALIPIGVYACDAEGRINFYNQRAAELWGRAPRGDAGPSFCGFAKLRVSSAAAPLGQDLLPMAAAIREGKPFRDVEAIAERADGATFPVLMSVDPIRNDFGQVNGAIGVFEDISERKQIEMASQRLAAIVESSDDAIVSKDLNGIVTSWNQGAERVFGYNASEVIGKSITILMPPECQSEEGPILERIRRGERIAHYETIRCRKDGTRINISLTVSPMKNRAGTIVGASKVARDITERKKAEERLAIQSAVNRILAESESVKEACRRILEAICQMGGWDFGAAWTKKANQQELICSDLWPFSPSDSNEFAAASRKFTFARGVGIPGRVWETREPIWVSGLSEDFNFPRKASAAKEGFQTVMAFPVLPSNEAHSILEFYSRHLRPRDPNTLEMLVGVGQQIGQFVERKRAEHELRELQRKLQQHAQDLEIKVQERTGKLRETIGQLEAFSYSVSHDMRAPLRAMQGFADALVRDHADQLNEQGKDYLRRIHRAAHRLDLLIRDVLTYSRIAKEDLHLRPLNLDRFLEEILHSYPQLEKMRSQIEIKWPLGTVLAHEAFLSQIISNILTNAFKFVAPDRVPLVRVWTERQEPFLQLNFQDNGLGIAPEHQNRIFQIFGRVYSDKKFDGTGIGLAIVKKAVERMGGEVGVESHLGEGSRFWLKLQEER